MANEAAVPDSLQATVNKMIDDRIAQYASSGPLRNASISGLPGLTVKAGSKIVVEHPDGGPMILAGAYDVDDTFDMPDGTDQPMFLLRRADGTLAIAMYDPDPVAGGFQQFVALLDRAGNIIVSDDADAGQGLARPYLGGGFGRARFADWDVSTTSPTFVTLWETLIYKQNPRLEVGIRTSMDTAATTGETRVLVGGVQLGATSTESFATAYRFFGPAAIAGTHEAPLQVEIQGRITSASGALRVEARYWAGRQS